MLAVVRHDTVFIMTLDETRDYRLQTADGRRQTTDFRKQMTENREQITKDRENGETRIRD